MTHSSVKSPVNVVFMQWRVTLYASVCLQYYGWKSNWSHITTTTHSRQRHSQLDAGKIAELAVEIIAAEGELRGELKTARGSRKESMRENIGCRQKLEENSQKLKSGGQARSQKFQQALNQLTYILKSRVEKKESINSYSPNWLEIVEAFVSLLSNVHIHRHTKHFLSRKQQRKNVSATQVPKHSFATLLFGKAEN